MAEALGGAIALAEAIKINPSLTLFTLGNNYSNRKRSQVNECKPFYCASDKEIINSLVGNKKIFINSIAK